MKHGLVLFLLLTCTLAAVQEVKIVSTVDVPITTERVVLELTNDMSQEVTSASFNLPSDAGAIEIEDKYGDLNFVLSKQGEVAVLVYNFSHPLEIGETRLIILEYITQQNLRQKKSEWEFLMVFLPSREIQIEHTLELPKKYLLSTKEQVVSPNAEISYTAEKTSVVWNTTGNKDESIVFIARFKEENPGINIWWVAAVVGAIIFGFFVGTVFQKGKKIIDKKRKLDSIKVLTEDDRRLLEDIIEKPGIKQHKFIEKYDLSKASLSKRVTNLANRGLITKKKRGRKNYLYPGPNLD